MPDRRTDPPARIHTQVLIFMKEVKEYGVLTPVVQAHVSMMAIVGGLDRLVLFVCACIDGVGRAGAWRRRPSLIE